MLIGHTTSVSIKHFKDNHMQTVRVSPKFQVVIPKELSERLKLRPGRTWRSTKSRDRFASRFRTDQRVFAGWLAVSSGKKATAIVPKGSELFLVDSSGWIEFLEDGPLADRFAP
jgi:hypothetical protein